MKAFKAIVIGASAGGVETLNRLFEGLPEHYNVPVIVVLHIGDSKFVPSAFYAPEGVLVKEADEKEAILPQHIYFAPSSYHLLIEEDLTFSLTVEEKVQFARPSIDVTFSSAADSLENDVLGILLTGANDDGAEGLKMIQSRGGFTIVQDPDEAIHNIMPLAGIASHRPDKILPLKEIVSYLKDLKGSYES